MYCNNCGEYFDDPVVGRVDLETGYKDYSCPFCGDDSIEETTICKCCGQDRVKEQEFGSFCEDCKKELAEELEDLQERFSVTAEVLEDMICEHYGY